jgi:hypothetical protein
MNTSDTFLAIFIGNKNSPRMTAWNALSEETRHNKMQDGIAAWKAWVEKHQAAIVGMGGPLSPASEQRRNAIRRVSPARRTGLPPAQRGMGETLAQPIGSKLSEAKPSGCSLSQKTHATAERSAAGAAKVGATKNRRRPRVSHGARPATVERLTRSEADDGGSATERPSLCRDKPRRLFSGSALAQRLSAIFFTKQARDGHCSLH